MSCCGRRRLVRAENRIARNRARLLTVSCSAPVASQWTKRHRGPYGQRPVRSNDRHALVLYEEGWSYRRKEVGGGTISSRGRREVCCWAVLERRPTGGRRATCLARSQLVEPMSELALVTVGADASASERTALLGLRRAGGDKVRETQIAGSGRVCRVSVGKERPSRRATAQHLAGPSPRTHCHTLSVSHLRIASPCSAPGL